MLLRNVIKVKYFEKIVETSNKNASKIMLLGLEGKFKHENMSEDMPGHDGSEIF